MTAAKEQTNVAASLGFKSGQIVQEYGYDNDTDEELREAISAITGSEIVDEDFQDIADAVLLWFREKDGSLSDALVEAVNGMQEGGPLCLLTPKAGRDGHVEPSDIGEDVQTAGLAQTASFSATSDWNCTRLVSPGRKR
jgi:hypothetical protein